MTQENSRRRGGQTDNRNVGDEGPYDSSITGGSDLVREPGTSSVVDENDRLFILRDRLLSLAKKYPVHARSISQLASCVDLLTHLPVVPCF